MSLRSQLLLGLRTLLGADPIDHIPSDEAGDALKKLVTTHDINIIEYLDPIRAIHELRDTPDVTYIWTLSEDATGEDMQQLAERIHDAHGGEPRALHMFIRNVDELQKFDYHEVEHEILPWLIQAKARNGELEH